MTLPTCDHFDYDYIVIGSGFGGAVSAHRLAEKGYSVGVLEMGKRWRSEDFKGHNWDWRVSNWFPKLHCFGIAKMTMFKDVFIFGAAGVGGGSLNYANTHLEPMDAFYDDPQWAEIQDWRKALAPHYKEARRMLGSVEAPTLYESDNYLKEIAEEMGVGDTFHKVDVGVYFGKPDQRAPDPFFDGKGPDRTGCNLCGNCMIGCPHGAKNTLDKNYLYFAEKNGAVIHPETRVLDVRPFGQPDGSTGYQIQTEKTTGFGHTPKTYHAKGVVFSAGVVGTLDLLLRCKNSGSLPNLSSRLGHTVRTNNEALTAATQHKGDGSISRGIAITSGFHPDPNTHIELARYGVGADSVSGLTTVLVGGGGGLPRWVRWLGNIVAHPVKFARTLWPFGWSSRTTIVLTMQPISSTLGLFLKRGRIFKNKLKLQTYRETGSAVPTYIPVANEVTQRLADKVGGDPESILPEVMFNLSSTAHILGGACIGKDAESGVIDPHNRVFGYENLLVADGSTIPANLGVNPSLTITALSEHAMSHIPMKKDLVG